MTDIALFQMWGPFRQSLIDGHVFYVEQARKRLLSRFDDIEVEAERASEEWLKLHKHHFDPDRHDPSDFYDAAQQAGVDFYELLSDMREQTRLSVVAGIYHEWDKQLRDWIVSQARHWHKGEHLGAAVWAADFKKVMEFLECLGWKVQAQSYFALLDACRLVVNVYKHGDGKSLDELRRIFPDYLDDPFDGMDTALSDAKYRDHTHLRVTDAHLQDFSDAVVEFWKDCPENVFGLQINNLPDWFEKAAAKDSPAQHQTTSKK
ncbi:MAG: hypothetical protein ACK4Y9_00070 [Hyphomonas sp.]